MNCYIYFSKEKYILIINKLCDNIKLKILKLDRLPYKSNVSNYFNATHFYLYMIFFFYFFYKSCVLQNILLNNIRKILILEKMLLLIRY